MSDDPRGAGPISGTDARRLLARAAELQGERHLVKAGGASLDDVRRAAAEAGIDAASLEQAAAELGLASPDGDLAPFRLLDQAVVIERQARAALTAEERAALVDLARGEYACVGETEEQQAALVWRSGAGAGRASELTASKDGDRVTLRLVQKLKAEHWAAVFTVGTLGALLGMGASVLVRLLPLGQADQVLATLVAVLVLGTIFGVTAGRPLYQWLLQRAARQHTARLQTLADRMVRRLGQGEGRGEAER